MHITKEKSRERGHWEGFNSKYQASRFKETSLAASLSESICPRVSFGGLQKRVSTFEVFSTPNIAKNYPQISRFTNEIASEIGSF